MDSTLKLLSGATKDALGVFRPSGDPREVFCQVSSVSSSEWFEGGRIGLSPDLRVTVFAGDYAGEQAVEHEGVKYAVYRTYRDGDYVELYLQQEKGARA